MPVSSWIARVLRLPSRLSRRQRRASRRQSPQTFRPSLERLEDRVVPSILTVNTTADSTAPGNALTLREAILLVDNGGNAQAALGRNLTAGEARQISGTFGVQDTIQFDITAASDAAGGGSGYDPTTGVATIHVGSALPVIIVPVTIDGTTQPGYTGTPPVVLSGLGAGNNVSGLVVAGGNSTVTGLVINQFSGDGIDLTTNGGDLVADDYIGTDVTGTRVAGNGGNGVRINNGASNNSISADLIANNAGAGVALLGASSIKNTIARDSINNNAGGGISNTSGSVTVSNCTLTGNSANSGAGIYNHVGTMTVSNSTLSGNSATNPVGGIYNDGALTLRYGTTGFNGSLIVGNAATGTATFTDAGDFTGRLTVNNSGNLQSLSVSGTIMSGSSITVLGTLSNSTIGTNNGTVSAGYFSSMTVATNSTGGSISTGFNPSLAATQNNGTASNVNIGTNNGMFVAGTPGAPDAGAITDSTININNGMVSAGTLSSLSVTTNNIGGSILAGSISGMSVGINNGIIRAAGQGTISNLTVSTNTNTGTITAPEDGTSGSGTMTSTTITSNAGTVSTGSISGMSVGTNSGTISAAGQGTTSNLTVGTNTSTGTISAPEDSTSGSGTMTSTTITSNAGTVSTGSISGMSVGTNSGTISAAGHGTTTGLTVGTNTSTGTISAPEDSTSGSGTMTSTTITSNAGTVSTGSISGMSVGTNSGTISSAGHGTTTGLTVGTNTSTGTISVPEDSTSGSGTMTSTTITSNAGTVSTGSISGMSVGTNSGTISSAGHGTTTGLTVGTNTSTGTISAPEDSTSGSGTMTSTTITSNAGTVSTGSISGMSVGTNSGTISAAGKGTTYNVTIGNNSGTFVAVKDSSPGSGTMSNTTIGTNTGTVSADTISTMTVTTIGATGTVTATETISNLSVSVVSGTLVAGTIQSLSAINAPGTSQMLNVVEGGVTRQLVLSPATAIGTLPQYVSYIYDHNPISGDAQLTLSVNEGANAGSYDVELLSSSAAPGSGFDLAALYNSALTPTHIRNVLIEGNLAPYAGDASQLGITSTMGGVQLPLTALASVAILGNAPAGSVNAASVQAVSFASITEPTFSGPVTVLASAASAWDAAQLLAPGTAVLQANNVFLAAAGQTPTGQSQPVALFLDTGAGGSEGGNANVGFDSRSVLLGNQGNVIGATSPVLAQVLVTIPFDSDDNGTGYDGDERSLIQTINLTGAGGSIQTAQRIASAITSTGALGNLILQSGQGIEANITAPSIFGNIAAPNGGISGIIQATTGNIGRVLFDGNGCVTGVTSIWAASGLSGTILSAGDLISWIDVSNGFQGSIAAGGNLGYLVASNGTILNRLGGINVSGGFSGDAVFLGNIYGDISISGGLNGRIAAEGAPDGLGAGQQGILGNVNIWGDVGSSAAIVSGGEIGDAGTGTTTDLNVYGSYTGILAAVGQVNYVITGNSGMASIFNNVGGSSASGQAVNIIFSGQILDALTIGDLAALLSNLNALHVDPNGNLSDS